VALAGGQVTVPAQTWSQAGAVRIFGSASYQGQSINPPGPGQQTILNPVLGRFAAHHFVVSPSSGCGTFTYSGQPFSSVLITAMNADSVPVKDVNYTSSFARKVTLSDANAFAGGSLKIAGGVAEILAASFTSGEATAQPTYTFASANTVPTSIKIRATDTDGVASSGETASEIRSGRLWLGNAYGSEFLPLKVPTQAQYWATSGWRQNSADSCTSLTMPTRQDTGNGGLKFYAPPNDARTALAPGEVIAQMNSSTAASVAVTAGDARLVLRHPTLASQGPGTGNFGYLDVIGSKLTSSAWLPPTGNARVCFGSCGPRSPVIHFRENY
jgi:MSHA biogenesis protein MshQ